MPVQEVVLKQLDAMPVLYVRQIAATQEDIRSTRVITPLGDGLPSMVIRWRVRCAKSTSSRLLVTKKL
jgi:hypothetical protein